MSGEAEGLPPRTPGFVVCFPDSHLQAEFLVSDDRAEAEAFALSLSPRSRWPRLIHARPCWIHEWQKTLCVEGAGISIRRHWTPRQISIGFARRLC